MFEAEDREIMDVVNENDDVIGTIARGDMMSLRETPGRYIRAVDIFLQRQNGDVYLPRRSAEKKIAPGGLDLSAAGHNGMNESYQDAAVREIKEELGIETSADRLERIVKIGPSATLFYFRELYLLRSDRQPLLSPEHTEAVWVAPDRLSEFVRNDVPTKEVLAEDIPLLLDYLANDGS